LHCSLRYIGFHGQPARMGQNMKRVALVVALSVLTGSTAFAADLPPAPPPPPPRAPAVYAPAPIPYYNWTGFYIGGNLGGAWNQGGFSDPAGNNFPASNTIKFLGGGQVGYNLEFGGGVLLGVEAMFDWGPNSNNTVNTTFGAPFTPPPVAVAGTFNNSWLTTVTGRLGYAWDRLLVYGKGGGAWVGATSSPITIGGTSFSASPSGFGWTIGAGLEYAFWGTWSARIEYDYIGLASQTVTVPVGTGGLGAPDVFTGNMRNLQMVTLGINYKFGY
jgi:outer membrane immunogenic protein